MDQHLAEVRGRLQRRQEVYGQLTGNYDSILEEITNYQTWLEDAQSQMRQDRPIGHTVHDAESSLTQIQVGPGCFQISDKKYMYFSAYGKD